MTLAIGDHLVIKRNGVIVEPKNEEYHEYEVVAGNSEGDKYIYLDEAPNSKYPPHRSCRVKLEVVE